ncbi:hypothetical protein [uncultured Jatrophihabitans sp.]|uniref:hypothetical protein n=1 Tax=uncultured Jatrophihabitans sp. TaxID=1610747 RepID=UPI0035CBD0DC
MDDITTTTPTTTEIHDHYVAQINHLVSEGRETLIADLTAEYEQLRNERRAA